MTVRAGSFAGYAASRALATSVGSQGTDGARGQGDHGKRFAAQGCKLDLKAAAVAMDHYNRANVARLKTVIGNALRKGNHVKFANDPRAPGG